MTPVSLIYLLLGVVSLLWPLAILLFKRRVLDAQWMMMTALFLFGISVIIYSTFFNNFLRGEYLLVIIYMVLSLSVLPVTQAAVAVYTRPGGASLTSRLLLVPSLATIALMGLSVAVGGADMYRLWIARGAETLAARFYSGSWRYNLIVAVHYYLYWAVLIAEAAYVTLSIIVSLRKFSLTLNEYYASSLHKSRNIRGIYSSVGVNCLCVLANYILFPFNVARPVRIVAAITLVQAASVFLLGWYLYHLNYGAEQLSRRLDSNRYGRGNLAELGKKIVQYVENENYFRNPDLSVFTISERYKVSQDDVVDAVHRLHGTSFAEYIDNLRIEHSLLLLADPAFSPSDPDQLLQLAHRCGFLDRESFEHAFKRIMQTSVDQWVEN